MTWSGIYRYIIKYYFTGHLTMTNFSTLRAFGHIFLLSCTTGHLVPSFSIPAGPGQLGPIWPGDAGSANPGKRLVRDKKYNFYALHFFS